MGWELVDQRTVLGQAALPQETMAVVREVGPATRPTRRRTDFTSPFTWDREAREEANREATVEQPDTPLLARAFRSS